MNKTRTKGLILISLFAALTAIGAFIKIPIPYVPITLQLLFCVYSGILLGARWGLYSQLLYLAIGLIGIPIFTNGGGPSYVLQPTFGYLVGFVLCSYIVGRLTENLRECKFHKVFGAVLVGIIGLYICGLTHLYIILNFYLHKPASIQAVIGTGLIPFIPTDLISAVIATLSSIHILPILRRSGLLITTEQ
ncbi:MAG: biotin transporter BioY [Caldicoprobacterales bacterium]|jgi:biotin transport system substrate-specific component